MGYLPSAPPPHHCRLPMVSFRRMGTRWQCDICQTTYQIGEVPDGWDVGKGWVKE